MTAREHRRGQPTPVVFSVAADLDIDVDGHSARLEGDGRRLVLRSDNPELLWSSLLNASLPDEVGNVSGLRSVGRAASKMADAGIHLDVEGPRGTVVGIGDGEDSRFGRLVTGSAAVQPKSVRSLLPFIGVVVRKVLHRNPLDPRRDRAG